MPEHIERIALIRHGQTVWNTGGRLQGSSDTALDPTGEQQAEAAGARLAGHGTPWRGSISSDLERAHRTATIMGERLGLGDPLTLAGLRERDYGPAEGMTLDEVIGHWPAVGERTERAGWKPGDSLNDLLVPEDIPGLESRESCADRAAAALETALARLGGSPEDGAVLVVAHGTLIRYLVERLTGADLPLPGNAEGFWLERSPEGDWSLEDTRP